MFRLHISWKWSLMQKKTTNLKLLPYMIWNYNINMVYNEMGQKEWYRLNRAKMRK